MSGQQTSVILQDVSHPRRGAAQRYRNGGHGRHGPGMAHCSMSMIMSAASNANNGAVQYLPVSTVMYEP